MKKEEMKKPRYSTKVLMGLFIAFNVPFLFAVASLETDIAFWHYRNPLFQFWVVYNTSIICLILGIEKPKTMAGFIAIANTFLNQGRKVKDLFRDVDKEVGFFRDKTTVDNWGKPPPPPVEPSVKPAPLPLKEVDPPEEKPLEEIPPKPPEE